jgi:hypothetical protein
MPMKTKRFLILLFASCIIVYCASALIGATESTQSGKSDQTGELSASSGYDHIFLIMEENVGYEAVIGSPDAPYINKKLLPQGALFTKSFGMTHPSLPNYLAMFSGSTQWVTDDHCLNGSPPNGPFNAPNLYSELKKVGKTALAYMESLPNDGYTDCKYNGYVQKHNPFMFFNAGQAHKVPYSATVVYNGPYSSTATWPNFALICPNTQNDMHDGATIPIKVKTGDTWLSKHLPPLITYAKNNNGLIILTMDESHNQHVPTILVGTGVAGGQRVTQRINHYNVTRTISDNFGAAPIGESAGVEDLLELTP